MIPLLFLRDGDGHVSPQEFLAALRTNGAAGVLPTEALALYRTAAEQGEGLNLCGVLGFWLDRGH